MDNAVLQLPTKILFGKDTETQIGAEVAKYAKRVLLHYGGGSAERSGLLDRVRASLRGAGVTFFELGGVQPNPVLSLVYKGIDLCRENGVELVLAVGGGSVIDSAKSIAVGAPNPQDDVWDYFLGKKSAEKILPVATVLTIPGAGSESSDGEVISNEETKQKMSYGDARCVPVVSVLNPVLTYTIPAYHTAAGIVDGISHIMERYFTNTRHVDVTDRLCESCIRSLVKYGKRALEEPENYDVRAEIMWACKVAHDGYLGFGREEDWASHMIEHELSAKYDVSHGAGLAVVFPAWMKYVYHHDKDRFAQFAMRVFDIEYDFENPDLTIQKCIARLTAFYESMRMPVTLRQLGLKDQSSIREMAEKCIENGGGSRGSFVVLGVEDVVKILESAF